MKFGSSSIKKTIEDGINGNAIFAPIGFNRMGNEGVKIFPKCLTIIGGMPGSGKSAFFHEAYVHNSYEWWYDAKKKNVTDIEMEWIIYSMERSIEDTKLKWIARKIFRDSYNTKNPVLFDTMFLKGFKAAKVTKEIKELVYNTFDYYEEMFSHMLIFEGSHNPTGIYKTVEEHALSNGKLEESIITSKDGKEFIKRTYIPNNSKKIVIVGIDHIGLCKAETIDGIKYKSESRELLGKMSAYAAQEFRDKFYYSPVLVSQFNRGLENTARFGNDVVIPQPSDFKNQSNTFEDTDIALALFNPYKLGETKFLGYDLKKMLSPIKANRSRFVTVLKNSYGIDDKAYPLIFFGENGFTREAPQPDKMSEEIYSKIQSYDHINLKVDIGNKEIIDFLEFSSIEIINSKIYGTRPKIEGKPEEIIEIKNTISNNELIMELKKQIFNKQINIKINEIN